MEKKCTFLLDFIKKNKQARQYCICLALFLKQPIKILCHENHFKQIKSIGICCTFPLRWILLVWVNKKHLLEPQGGVVQSLLGETRCDRAQEFQPETPEAAMTLKYLEIRCTFFYFFYCLQLFFKQIWIWYIWKDNLEFFFNFWLALYTILKCMLPGKKRLAQAFFPL